MDSSHLSSIPTDIDLKEVPPLNRRRVVAMFNCYMMKMTDFLNTLVDRCEHVVLETERQLRVIDTRLQILEHKLAGIQVDAVSSQPPAPLSTAEVQQSVPASVVQNPTPQVVPSEQEGASSASAPAATTTAAPLPSTGLSTVGAALLVKDDPLYSKYFKMLRMGVPEPAVKLKMQGEGVDPSMLDSPDSPSPNGTSSQQQKNAEDDAVSDSDDDHSDVSFSDSD